jgi:tripartite-type tricarboxylate transporter receptor subunit TctC
MKTFKNTPMRVLAVLALLLSFTQGLVHGADFPNKDKQITLIVPFAAGGPTDRVARDLSEAMRRALGVAVVVENDAGGPGGLIGASKLVRS